jgi:hypothetical protein
MNVLSHIYISNSLVLNSRTLGRSRPQQQVTLLLLLWVSHCTLATKVVYVKLVAVSRSKNYSIPAAAAYTSAADSWPPLMGKLQLAKGLLDLLNKPMPVSADKVAPTEGLVYLGGFLLMAAGSDHFSSESSLKH